MSELKACPFCGGEAMVVVFGDTSASVGCHAKECPATLSRVSGGAGCDVQALREKWNARPGEHAAYLRALEDVRAKAHCTCAVEYDDATGVETHDPVCVVIVAGVLELEARAKEGK